MKKYPEIFSLFVVFSIWISIASACGPLLLCFLAGKPPDYAAALIVFLVTFAVYSIDKVSGSKEDLANTPERAILASYPIGQIATSAYVAAIAICLYSNWREVPYVLIPGLAGVAYTARIGSRRLKDIPGMKNLTVAISSGLCYAGLVGGAAWAYAFVFLTMMIDTIIFDMRDLVGDKAACVQTIPVLAGPSRTVAILSMLCLLLAVISLPMAAGGAFLIAYFSRKRPNLEYDFLVDGWLMWIYVGSLIYVLFE